MGPFRKDHIPELDGLRGIAVLLVLWVHVPLGPLGETVDGLRRALLPGNVGVDLFFVLSGFLITRILLVDRERGVPLRYFLARRFLRIFPIYYLAILLLLPRLSAAEVAACATYTSNYAFVFMWSTSALEHTWSLAVEEHFYLLWPPLVAFLAPRRSRRILLLTVAPLALATVTVALLVPALAGDEDRFTEFVLRTSTVRFFSLGLGALIAYHESWLRARRSRALGAVLACLVLAWALSPGGASALGHDAVFAAIPGPGSDVSRYRKVLAVLSIPFGSAAAVLLAVGLSARRAPHGVLLRSAPLRGIGRISYGVYLYHFPLFTLPLWGGPPGDASLARVGALIALSLAAAWLSFVFIERPLLTLGSRFRGTRPAEATPMARGRRAAGIAGAAAVALLLGWLLRGGAVDVLDALVGP
jgi:peptidoglycan/LPS O-acetylase OafA/YrhL